MFEAESAIKMNCDVVGLDVEASPANDTHRPRGSWAHHSEIKIKNRSKGAAPTIVK